MHAYILFVVAVHALGATANFISLCRSDNSSRGTNAAAFLMSASLVIAGACLLWG